MKIHKLGKKPAKVDARTLKLSKYLRLPAPPAPPSPPSEVSWITHVRNWPMFMNDRIGDCVPAGAAHAVEQWTQYACGQEAAITDAQVLKAYEDVGGYDPDDPSTDQGCSMLDMLKYWRKAGIGGHKILAFVSVDQKNLTEVAQAIMLFGNVYAGVQLPLSAQGADKWTVADGGI